MPEAVPALVTGTNTEERLADGVGLPDHQIGAFFDQGDVMGPSPRRVALLA